MIYESQRVICREKTYLVEVKIYFEAYLQREQHTLRDMHLL